MKGLSLRFLRTSSRLEKQKNKDVTWWSLYALIIFLDSIALDYCVWYSAKDSQKLGYETFVIKDATRGINSNRIEQALDDMEEAGIKIINSDVLINTGVVKKYSVMFILFGVFLSTLSHVLSLYA